MRLPPHIKASNTLSSNPVAMKVFDQNVRKSAKQGKPNRTNSQNLANVRFINETTAREEK